MTRILITGAGGFVGTYLIKELQKDSSNDIYGAVFKSTSDISTLLGADHIIEGDLGNSQFAFSLVEQTKSDVIFHLAALSVVGSSVDKAVSVMNTNTTISYNILEAVKTHAPKSRFIAICSANEYGAVTDTSKPIAEDTPLRPLNPYGVSKVNQEMLALMYHLAYGLDVVILRPFNHIGIGQTTEFVIPKLAEQFVQIENGGIPPVLTVGNLDSIRDFTDVADMVHAYALAAIYGKSGESYNLGSGIGHTIKEIIEIFQSLCPVKVEIRVDDVIVRASDVPVLVCDASKFKAISGWEPRIKIEETISAILNSYKSK